MLLRGKNYVLLLYITSLWYLESVGDGNGKSYLLTYRFIQKLNTQYKWAYAHENKLLIKGLLKLK